MNCYSLLSFILNNLNFIKYNYEIYNKALLIIINYFEIVKIWIRENKIASKNHYNYNNLEYLITTKIFTWYQTCWIVFLLRLNFYNFYILVKEN